MGRGQIAVEVLHILTATFRSAGLASPLRTVTHPPCRNHRSYREAGQASENCEIRLFQKGGSLMPRPTNFISVVQKLVREQVQRAIHGLLGSATPKKKAKDGRRRRR